MSRLVKKSLLPWWISRAPIFLLKLLVFLSLGSSLISASNVKIVLTASQPVVDFVTLGGTTYSICLNQENQFSVLAIFSQLNIDVVAPSSYRFQWHSVKGVSSDDFHSNVQRFVYGLFGTDEEKASKVLTSSDFPQNFFRDIVSSCPSPFYSTDRSRCLMPFSPFGEACVQVRTDQSVQLMATARQDLNLRLPFSMIFGLFLIRLSNTFSKSSLFQYSSGILIFIIGGFLVLGWIFSKRVIYGSRRDLSTTQLTGMTALIAGSYGASTVMFLRAYLRTICMEYAEYGLAYMVLMTFVGLTFVRFVRNMEGSKHVLRVSVKWLLRFSGLVFIFNSSASPMISLYALCTLFVVYLGYVLLKSVRGSSKKKKMKDK